jgi:hypothetical protein
VRSTSTRASSFDASDNLLQTSCLIELDFPPAVASSLCGTDMESTKARKQQATIGGYHCQVPLFILMQLAYVGCWHCTYILRGQAKR